MSRRAQIDRTDIARKHMYLSLIPKLAAQTQESFALLFNYLTNLQIHLSAVGIYVSYSYRCRQTNCTLCEKTATIRAGEWSGIFGDLPTSFSAHRFLDITTHHTRAQDGHLVTAKRAWFKKLFKL